MSLATKKMQERWERERNRRHELYDESDGEGEGKEVDLFSRDGECALRLLVLSLLLSAHTLGVLSLVHRRVRNPVVRLAKEVKKNVAKTADINPDLKTVDSSNGDPVKDRDKSGRDVVLDGKPHASTSAHAVSGVAVNEQLHRPTSQRTKSARRLHIPTDENGETEDSQRFPDFAPPSRRDTALSSVGTEEEYEEEQKDFDVHGFDHPSTYEPQRWVWLPRDPYGLSTVLLGELRRAGVEASDEGAKMDEQGNVEVYRSPPDEEWSGGHDA